ncbi:MAG TPA: metal ABC transporter ATP-binding protein [Phycisphaerales bacterium]|nr:metal ABC transporter ATP-binding protein [Phycisphaerales bacterium]
MIPAVEVHDLSVAYHRKPVLWDIDTSIPAGRLAAIIGPNGAGKSTLLKSILGLVPLASGYVRVFGEPLSRVRRRVGYVPQRETVDWDFPIDAIGVVLLGRYGRLGWIRRPSRQDRQIAMQCLEQVHMQDFADRQISQLSGGQQQRVFLARALAQQADLYLMDEPFAGVDAATERAIIDLLRTLREQGKTVVTVHHDLQTVREYFDYVVMLNLRLVASGPTGEAFTPQNLQATYGGRLTILDRAAEAVRHGALNTVAGGAEELLRAGGAPRSGGGPLGSPGADAGAGP